MELESSQIKTGVELKKGQQSESRMKEIDIESRTGTRIENAARVRQITTSHYSGRGGPAPLGGRRAAGGFCVAAARLRSPIVVSEGPLLRPIMFLLSAC
ncbi:hypothetical protein EVAR_79591_1 [Eumeta japonica]|uniref:Uncharacterized protein n=1 Tax=Eumeta variegata TaxID=151549 RepID=A0A4C1UFQ2_EUMVA|nr:hypothetical protein EVAR_79591_1 [Eumeta japonica]